MAIQLILIVSFQLEKKPRGYSGADGSGAGEPSTSDGDLARRLSRRQEKAPERGEDPSVPSSPAPAPASTLHEPEAAPASPTLVNGNVHPETAAADAPSHAPVSDTDHATSSAAPDTNTTPEPSKDGNTGLMSKFKEMLK